MKPKDIKVHAENILFRAEHGLNYPLDNKVLITALKNVAPAGSLMRVLQKAIPEVFKMKEEAAHAAED